MLPSTSIYIFSCCEVGFVPKDTLGVAPEPETGLNKAEIALLHELCGTEEKIYGW